MHELTQEEKLYLLKKRKISYLVIRDGEIKKEKYRRDEIVPTYSTARCWCKFNKGNEIVNQSICLGCGTKINNVIENPELKMKSDDPKNFKVVDNKTLDTFFYVRKHPDKENGIQIMKLSIIVRFGKKKDDEEKLEWKIGNIIEIIPNETSRAYKLSRGNEVAVDIFDALQINSKMTSTSPTIEFENSLSVIDFMLKNKKFNQYTGFLECFNISDVLLPKNSFFMMYMYLYAQYPVIEFVVKMGYINLMTRIMNKLSSGWNKEMVRREANEITKILNPDATNGSMALTVPKYIADDLNEKCSYIDEYIMWGDICAIADAKTISKENYMTATRNNTYVNLYGAGFRNIPNIIKYGYSMNEIIKYIEKQYNGNDYHVTWYLTIFHDYLNMCDLMNIKPDKFPKDVKKAHDNVQSAFRAKENEMSDKAIRTLADEAKKYLPKTKLYEKGEYVILLPNSVSDVVQEGQAQHNCVGSYVDRIVKKRSLVFFIRRKEEPNQSFITAEFAHGKLNQIFYKNNRAVYDKDILSIANDYVKNLDKAMIL